MNPSQKPSPRDPKGNLTEGSVRDHLVRLSVPMIWGIAAIVSFQLVDTYFISRLGKAELTAISFTFPVTYFIFSFTMGFGIAMASVASRMIGEGRQEDVRRVSTHGLLLALIVACIISLLGILTHDRVFAAMGAAPETIKLIREYMILWFAGNVFVTLPLVGNAAIRAKGDTFSPAMIMCVAAGMNLILAPLLIFGGFGVPAMGMQGAALATVFSNLCAMLAGLWVMARKDLLLRPANLHLDQLKDSARRLLVIALPVGLTNGIGPLVNAAIVGMLAVQSEAAVSAFGVATRVEAFTFIILMALSIGMAPIIGQNWGAGKPARALEAIRLTLSFNIVWSVSVAVMLMMFARPVAALFSADEEVIALIVLFFWLVPISYVFSNLVNGWCSVFNAIGKPQRSFTMIIVKMILLTLPCAWIGGMLMGTYGIFLAIAAVNTACGLAVHFWSWNTFTRRDSPSLITRASAKA